MLLPIAADFYDNNPQRGPSSAGRPQTVRNSGGAVSAGTSADDAQNAKIDKSARDFESLLLTNWLQGAQKSFSSVPGGDDDADADPGSDDLKGLAMQSLGTALTASGGIGLAHSIAQLLHKGEAADTSKIKISQIESES